jgi:hypothetical protein
MLFRGTLWLAWILYLAGCLLILSNTVSDYGPEGARIFIFQKGEIGESAIWKGSLYVHIAGGLLCLFSALPQLSGKITARFPALHRSAGKIYAASVLFLVCPTGFHLALFAKGGFFGKLGFLTLAFAAFYTTLAGWRAVLPPQRNMAAHRMWMIRSFALAASAITFRIYHTLGYLAGLEADTNYVASLWMSLLGNAAVTEFILHRKRIAAFLFLTKPQTQTEP